MRLKLISERVNGRNETSVIDLDTGEELKNLISVKFEHDAEIDIPTLTFATRVFEIEAEVSVGGDERVVSTTVADHGDGREPGR